jgi:hypothetical protein
VTVAYHIQDEPTGGGRAGAFILNPFWPLLGMMFAGAWLGALLFTSNAILLRGPTWRREIALAILMLVGAPALVMLLAILGDQGLISRRAFQYTLILVVVWKLAIGYWIFSCSKTRTRSTNTSREAARPVSRYRLAPCS